LHHEVKVVRAIGQVVTEENHGGGVHASV
jgi:hypothetical protein